MKRLVEKFDDVCRWLYAKMDVELFHMMNDIEQTMMKKK